MDSSLQALHTTIWAGLATRFTPEDVHASTRAAIVDALEHGITTVLDWCHIINTPEHGDAAIRAHRELPIRSVFAYGTSMRRKLAELEGRDGASAGAARAGRGVPALVQRPGDRMTFALALQGPESASMATTRREVASARERGLPITMHVGIRDARRPRASLGRPPRRRRAARRRHAVRALLHDQRGGAASDRGGRSPDRRLPDGGDGARNRHAADRSSPRLRTAAGARGGCRLLGVRRPVRRGPSRAARRAREPRNGLERPGSPLRLRFRFRGAGAHHPARRWPQSRSTRPGRAGSRIGSAR